MPAIFETLDALHLELTEMGNHSVEYWDKQVHTVERSKTVGREQFLVQLCSGKTVLHVGCTGPLDEALRKVAKKCYGVTKEPTDRPDMIVLDLDMPCESALGTWAHDGIEMIVCGEVLEHLSNPGRFLDALKLNYPTAPLVVTVPNAFNEAGAEWLTKRGRENVHKDHVSYYSVTTLTTLLRRAGYEAVRHYWYNGKPYVSEGIVLLARPRKG